MLLYHKIGPGFMTQLLDLFSSSSVLRLNSTQNPLHFVGECVVPMFNVIVNYGLNIECVKQVLYYFLTVEFDYYSLLRFNHKFELVRQNSLNDE